MKTIFGGKTGLVLLLLVVLLLAGLPVAVWLDLTNLAETNLKNARASDLEFDHQQRAQLLRQQRRRPHSCCRARRAYEGGAQLRDDPWGYSHAGDAVARTRQGDQRTTTQHHLSLLRLRTIRSPTARRIRSTSLKPMHCAGCAKIRIK